MKTKLDIRDFDSLYELFDYFDTEAKCEDYLANLRWNGKPECVHCGHDKVYVLKVKGRGTRYKCPACHYQGTVKSGTIFAESKIPLRKWYVAIYLITAHKKGISSHQLAKDIKVTQKTAWFLLHRVREAFCPDEMIFSNPVEIDETGMGGKESNKHYNKKNHDLNVRGSVGKVCVLGILERGGKVYAVPVPNRKSNTLFPIIKEKVTCGTTIYTDDYKSYNGLKLDYEHFIINHSDKLYVKGDIHTNSIESFWAFLKRGLDGIYHKTSEKHLGRYVNEFAFRFNNRDLTDGSKFDVLLAHTNKPLSYKQLTKKLGK
ncbi:MAG TPA: IS1595 family transposase [Cytophagaceae bacterium]|jgi:transposase-like protein|nr:IS1595 family transposase [Cytophagaceae bacterium]